MNDKEKTSEGLEGNTPVIKKFLCCPKCGGTIVAIEDLEGSVLGDYNFCTRCGTDVRRSTAEVWRRLNTP